MTPRLLSAVVLAWVLTAGLYAQSTVATNPLVSGEQATSIVVGAGGATAQTNGTIDGCRNITAVSNTSIGAEDILMSCTLPGNTLLSAGQGIRITAGGSFAANANTKSARMYFGATLVAYTSLVSAAPNNLGWRLTGDVHRQTGTTQVSSGIVAVAATSAWYILNANPAETLSGPILIKVVGFSATAATDVTARLFIAETLR